MRKRKRNYKERVKLARSMLYASAKGTTPTNIQVICDVIGIKRGTLRAYVNGMEAEAPLARNLEDFKHRSVTNLAVKHYHELRKGEKHNDKRTTV